ncbi:MAG: MarR family transcriptional regulator [Micrococcales bacterium]|nr:MarR family transcriptional regulator [Micrococcales bacterium]
MAEWPTGRLLSVAARSVERAWHAGLSELGLTHAGLIVLDLLAEGPVAQVDLARRGRVTPQTMSRTVDTLVAAGYVRRTADPLDRRIRIVERTEAGLRVFTASGSLESRIFPDVEGVGELRAALLQIIRAER